MFTRDCPCGSATAYDACCGPLHRGTSTATSPEQFVAHYDSPTGPGALHERSSFEQRAGRWAYVSGVPLS